MADLRTVSQRFKEIQWILLKDGSVLGDLIPGFNMTEKVEMMKDKEMMAAIDHGSYLGSHMQILYVCQGWGITRASKGLGK